MKVLVLGSGGREHALAWRLSRAAQVFAAPGNPGMCDIAECFEVSPGDVRAVYSLAQRLGVDLVVVGPEAPLIDGLADALRLGGFRVFGPGAQGAKLEGSKAFSKAAMQAAGIPTAEFGAFDDSEAAKEFARARADAGRQVVIKASGAALGKGVLVCDDLVGAFEAIDRVLVDREFGAAGDTVVVEDRLPGREFSLLTLCSDGDFRSLPVAQDYKRVGDGDAGPNTGGMGSFSPANWVTPSLVAETEETVVGPLLKHLQREGIGFRGTLFSGIMVDGTRPYCLEYNVRFGDPETQSIMPRLDGAFAQALLNCANGDRIGEIKVGDRAVVTVVIASGGYPGSYRKGVPITLPASLPSDVQVFHAGTARGPDGELVTAGGRVLNVTATGATVSEARAKAYAVASQVQFEGAFFRSDIAADA